MWRGTKKVFKTYILPELNWIVLSNSNAYPMKWMFYIGTADQRETNEITASKEPVSRSEFSYRMLVVLLGVFDIASRGLRQCHHAISEVVFSPNNLLGPVDHLEDHCLHPDLLPLTPPSQKNYHLLFRCDWSKSYVWLPMQKPDLAVSQDRSQVHAWG